MNASTEIFICILNESSSAMANFLQEEKLSFRFSFIIAF